MIKQKLTSKFFFLTVLSALLATCIAFAFLQFAQGHVNRKYNNPDYVEEKTKAYITKIQDYIDDHQISFNTLYKLQSWLDSEVVNSFTLYDDKGLVYDSYQPFLAGEGSSFHSHKPLPWKTLYSIDIQGKTYHLEISLFLKHRAMDIVHFGTLILFFITFVLSMLIFIRSKTKSLLRLNQEVQQVEQGNISQKISVRGEDELADLAANIENMRKAFVQRLNQLDAYHQESTSFVSSTSHDLKAPLATIIGYLELVLEYELNDPNLSRLYLQRSLDKAYHLKKLTNDLMDFFVVAQHNAHENKSIMGKKEFETLLIEEVLDLENQDFITKVSFITDTQYYISSDEESMKRILNNIFHNIRLHGDPEHPVIVNLFLSESHLCMGVSNHKNQQEVKRGDGIGLMNCEQLLQKWHGFMETKEEAEVFHVTLGFKLL